MENVAKSSGTLRALLIGIDATPGTMNAIRKPAKP